MGYQSRFTAFRCYKGEFFVDAMVQTRGQQTGDQSPPGCSTLWGVTVKEDAVATTVSSGNTLKHAVSAPVLNTAPPTLWAFALDGKVWSPQWELDLPLKLA